MSRSIGEMPQVEWNRIMERVVEVVRAGGYSGAVEGCYSLYHALDGEYAKARKIILDVGQEVD